MFKLTGILKKEEIREFTKKDGSQGASKTLFIEPEGHIYPIKVSVADHTKKFGKVGDKITLDLAISPYYIQDKQRKRAFVDYYIPKDK